ncbi:peptidase family M48-domain-containing protein [Staphylotrichum tortipilum]|uniref:Peptidase family M48-domain-containing protein n=1 Tax=Staphylotrichum tortipilum TaxID=2831512 RepID=A0AAN6RXL5_9PEZI|nr:peptidase family M48-domain-containing protein [Staphylotrichum longicolle]
MKKTTATAKPLVNWRGWGGVLYSKTTWVVVGVLGGGVAVFYFGNLETVPVTGRVRFNVCGGEVRELGELEFRKVVWQLRENGINILPGWDPRTRRVNRVMERLLPYSGLPNEDWEVYVVDDPRTANAFVLPGGKVFVFTGILGLAHNDSALATVLGHEIAHNLADHHGEQLSQTFGTGVVLYALSVLGAPFGLDVLIRHFIGPALMKLAFGLPMSRLQESEADYIGLMMMAQACYDPTEAVRFWERMEQATAAEDEPLEWMSTHPAHGNRIKKIQEWMSQAQEKRAMSQCGPTSGYAEMFMHALGLDQIG